MVAGTLVFHCLQTWFRLELKHWLSWDLPTADLGISQPPYSCEPVPSDNSPCICICVCACIYVYILFLWRTKTSTLLLLHGCFVLILHSSVQTQLSQPDFPWIPDLTSVFSSISAPLLFPFQPLCHLVMTAAILFTILIHYSIPRA